MEYPFNVIPRGGTITSRRFSASSNRMMEHFVGYKDDGSDCKLVHECVVWFM
ncbi:uncharacterized protein BDW43DRAFT_268198 [Aspergillus alliaceus]|uniref:uncharacterized protein n=1 Tax=Petromyces alliaceus TaxID=209559 RepID=UPI0012A47C3F|nr:uncharacterized protein BDW43DRAFT_268198 [Aspergillus alliaceus]KAB8236338.1 hypothetical protein BDW43DRAFT_268198 [Aspergillus alliaceus]